MLRRGLIRRIETVEARLAGRRHVASLDLSGLPTDLHGLPRDLLERITAAMQAGTFPEALCCADLEAIVAAGDKVRQNGP